MNTYWRNFRGRTVLSAGGREYKVAVQEYVSVKNLPKFGQERLGASITIFPRDKRSIDLDNRLKYKTQVFNLLLKSAYEMDKRTNCFFDGKLS